MTSCRFKGFSRVINLSIAEVNEERGGFDERADGGLAFEHPDEDQNKMGQFELASHLF